MPVQFGLIGYPLTHSFSQKYFTHKFSQLNFTNYSYQIFEIENLANFKSLIQMHPNLLGVNVTIPYKTEIIKFIDELDPVSKEINAVNTIKIDRHNNVLKLKGFNTDVYGFECCIKPFLEMHHYKAIILGNGGSAKAVKYVLKKLGIDFLVVSRQPKNENEINYNLLNKYLVFNNFLIINTTPVGMFPNIDEVVDFPFEFLSSKHFCVDLIYNPLETKFLKLAKLQGAKTLNGLSMLHLQADKSFEIWNNG